MSRAHDTQQDLHNRFCMFILDVLRHDDIEQLSSVLKLLNDDAGLGWREVWPHDFTFAEVAAAIRDLVQTRHINAFREDSLSETLIPVSADELNSSSDVESLWLALTETGLKLWDQWEPPKSADGR